MTLFTVEKKGLVTSWPPRAQKVTSKTHSNHWFMQLWFFRFYSAREIFLIEAELYGWPIIDFLQHTSDWLFQFQILAQLWFSFKSIIDIRWEGDQNKNWSNDIFQIIIVQKLKERFIEAKHLFFISFWYCLEGDSKGY